MALTYSWPGPTALATTSDGRKDLAGLIAKDAAGVARLGVFPAHANALVSARSDMNVDIAVFQAAAVQFGGPVLMANDGVAQLPSVLVSPGAGTNFYVIYAKQNESTAPGTDANNNRQFGAQLSTTSFAVARAAMPTGALELATVQMPTGKTATNQVGVTITATHQFTAAAGGVVGLRNATEQAAWSPVDSSVAYRLDTARFVKRLGGAWVTEPRIEYGTVSAVTGAGGDITVAHSLGATPSFVFVTEKTSGAAPATRSVKFNGSSSTQIQFLAYNGGAVFGSNVVAFDWMAVLS